MKCELIKRTPARLKGYDYSAPGAYFITVCTRNKECLLGNVVGCGDFDAPQMILSGYGKILDEYINVMACKYSHITVDKYVVMPNHFHMILRILDNGASETAAPYNGEIPKFVSLLKRYCNRRCGKSIWQRSFNDHIIRGEADYFKIWEYIDTNTARWQKDCYYK